MSIIQVKSYLNHSNSNIRRCIPARETHANPSAWLSSRSLPALLGASVDVVCCRASSAGGVSCVCVLRRHRTVRVVVVELPAFGLLPAAAQAAAARPRRRRPPSRRAIRQGTHGRSEGNRHIHQCRPEHTHRAAQEVSRRDRQRTASKRATAAAATHRASTVAPCMGACCRPFSLSLVLPLPRSLPAASLVCCSSWRVTWRRSPAGPPRSTWATHSSPFSSYCPSDAASTKRRRPAGAAARRRRRRGRPSSACSASRSRMRCSARSKSSQDERHRKEHRQRGSVLDGEARTRSQCWASATRG